MTLAHFYGINSVATKKAPEGLSQMERVDYYGNASPPAERLAVFADTVAMLEQDFGTWELPWGEVNRFQRLSGDIELEFDDEQPSVAIGMGNSGVNGNSFAAVVEFGERVRAKSILVGGQSNDPASGHFVDQVPRYANANWKKVAYYREDVETRARQRYAPGARN